MPFDQIKRKGNKNRNTHMSLRLYLRIRSRTFLPCVEVLKTLINPTQCSTNQIQVETKQNKEIFQNAIEAYESKQHLYEFEDLDPKTCCEWLDHSSIPFQHSTTSIGSSQVKLKIKCNICIEAYVAHSHFTQNLDLCLYTLTKWCETISKPNLTLN